MSQEPPPGPPAPRRGAGHRLVLGLAGAAVVAAVGLGAAAAWGDDVGTGKDRHRPTVLRATGPTGSSTTGRPGTPSAPADAPTAPSDAPTSTTVPTATVPSAPAAPTAPAAPPPGPGAPVADAAGLVAVAGVVDGDTIKVRTAAGTRTVRVIGIDTPELKGAQCYAQQAASRMQSLVQGKQVRLAADPTQGDTDRYGRLLRHVQLPDGRSVAELLIAGGFGREYTYAKPYAGQAAYRAAQATAQAARLGIWASGCTGPGGAVPPPRPQPSGSCLIKGNISSSGEKIYHLPGQRHYDVTKINTAKGERWFCTEAEAVRAGWRPARA